MNADSESEQGDTEEGTEESTDSKRGMTFEEWNRAASAANPLDSYLMEKKKFERAEPPTEAIKFYRQERTYYLLNRGEKTIDHLQYRVAYRDVNTKQYKATGRYEVTEVPPRSYFEIGEMDLESETRMKVELEQVEWADGTRAQEPRRLQLFQPSAKAVLPLDKLDLKKAEVEPSVIDESDS